jgi:hypothetical protein
MGDCTGYTGCTQRGVDDVGNVEIQTYYFMPTTTDRPDWVFEDDVEGPYNSEEEAKAKVGSQYS